MAYLDRTLRWTAVALLAALALIALSWRDSGYGRNNPQPCHPNPNATWTCPKGTPIHMIWGAP